MAPVARITVVMSERTTSVSLLYLLHKQQVSLDLPQEHPPRKISAQEHFSRGSALSDTPTGISIIYGLTSAFRMLLVSGLSKII